MSWFKDIDKVTIEYIIKIKHYDESENNTNLILILGQDTDQPEQILYQPDLTVCW